MRMRDGTLELTGPCGPDAWYIESHEEDDPMEIVRRLSTNLLGPPLLVHSTSWRRGFGGVLLTFLVVIGEEQALELEGVPVTRTDLARNSATEAAKKVSTHQVVEHALRHMAWLAQDDAAVRATLSPAWLAVLAGGTPATVTDVKPSLKTVDIPVDGMACVVCAASVRKTVKSLDGVSRVEVSLEKRSARVTYADGRISPERIVAAIDKLGYKAGTPRDVE